MGIRIYVFDTKVKILPMSRLRIFNKIIFSDFVIITIGSEATKIASAGVGSPENLYF